MPSLGVSGWVEEVKASRPGNAALQKQLDAWVEAYEVEERAREEAIKKAAAAAAEDGWTLVRARVGLGRRRKLRDGQLCLEPLDRPALKHGAMCTLGLLAGQEARALRGHAARWSVCGRGGAGSQEEAGHGSRGLLPIPEEGSSSIRQERILTGNVSQAVHVVYVDVYRVSDNTLSQITCRAARASDQV